MNIFLWILQIVLAAAFAGAGLMKVSQPTAKLVKSLPWVAEFAPSTIKLIGGVELLAALGLILPRATDIATVLTPLAATGLVVVMVLAAALHARRKEFSGIATNAVLLVLAAVVAWGRFGPFS